MAKLSVDQALLKARAHAQKGEIEDAKKLYQTVLHAFPHNKRAQQGLALLNKPKQAATAQTPPQEIIDQLINLYNQGQLLAVVAQAESLTKQYPEAFIVWNTLGAANKGLGQRQAASEAFKKVTELKPKYAVGFNNLGVTLQDQGKLEEAIASYEKALSLKPDYAEAYNNMGNALRGQGKLEEAIASYEKALSLKPDYAEAYNNMGTALKVQGKLEEAIASYEKALSLKPDFAEAYNNMGNALKVRGKLEEAIASYKKAIALKPDYAEAYYNMGNVYKDQGKSDKAIFSVNEALRLEPQNAIYGLATLNFCLPIVVEGGNSPNPLESFDRALREFVFWAKEASFQVRLTDKFGSSQPFYLAYYPENMKERLSQYADAVNMEVLSNQPGTQHKTKEKIKVGVVTAHLRRHSVFDVLMKGILRNLNREHFSVHVYCTDATKVEEQLVKELVLDEYFCVFGDTQKLKLRDKILSDDLDAIWYPEIGMDPLTSWLAVRRLAPVQFASWGHPITTGLGSMDYFLSGELIEGSDAESHYREKLVKLPSTGCLTLFKKNPPKRSTWEQEHFPKDKLTFLIPQSPFKFHPINDDLIIRIAQLFPDSKFLIPQSKKLPGSVEKILERMKNKFGSSDDTFDVQFITFPWMANDEFLSLMEASDIYLDLPSFSGYTTAWQGINCGIPIVTLEGEFMRQRLASGLLRKIGITENIAQSFEDYVSIVQRLAKLKEQPEQWQEYRQKIKNSAPKADNDLTVVRSFEQFVLKAVS